jgi:hypothetical protein
MRVSNPLSSSDAFGPGEPGERVGRKRYRRHQRGTMTGFGVKPLDETTWPDFALLVERHNGVWGGCWCMAFHAEGVGRKKTPTQNRSEKECRVREGRAHAALVYDGSTCVGWCQFGPTDELPRIKHRRAYLESLTALPDWRITCFFVTTSTGARGRLDRTRWRSTGDRAARGRNSRELPRGRRGPVDLCIVSPQWHRFDVRAPWVRANPSHRSAPLGGYQGRALTTADGPGRSRTSARGFEVHRSIR